MKVVGYVRVSTDEQALSTTAQEELLRQHAGEHDFVLFSDIGLSGGLSIDKRPGLRAALAALEQDDILMVVRRDRLARHLMTACVIDAIVKKAGATTKSLDGVGLTNGPEGHLMKAIVDAFAEYERCVVSVRVKAALAVKRSRGEVTGSVPYGYRRVGNRLYPEEEEQRVIAYAQNARQAGLSYRKIATRLGELSWQSRTGRPFHPQQIKRIVEGD